jgi:hypothetical protein
MPDLAPHLLARFLVQQVELLAAAAAAIHAIGIAHILEKREVGAASGAISDSMSAASSQRSVSGSSDWPVASACPRKMPLIPRRSPPR